MILNKLMEGDDIMTRYLAQCWFLGVCVFLDTNAKCQVPNGGNTDLNASTVAQDLA